MLVASVMMSTPTPPARVLTLLTAPVFAVPAKVSLFDPVPRSTDMPAVSAVPRVTVSSPVPPVTVSLLETVALFGTAGEDQRVAAGAEVDRAVGDGGTEGDGVVAGAADEGLERC